MADHASIKNVKAKKSRVTMAVEVAIAYGHAPTLLSIPCLRPPVATPTP